MNKITANIINSILAGSLVLLGACTDGEITTKGFILAMAAGGIVAITQFKEFWQKEEIDKNNTKKTKLLNFINI